MNKNEFRRKYRLDTDAVAPFERILIVGCGGSGKSTLAVRLGEVTGLPVVHLDKLYWLPGWVPRSREDFDVILAEQLGRPQWIMDGNFKRTLPARLKECDAVVVLDYPRAVCAAGVLRRVMRYKGRTRESMGDGCPERLDPNFLRWVWNFPKDTLPYVFSCIEERAQEQPLQVYLLRSRSRTRRWLAALGSLGGFPSGSAQTVENRSAAPSGKRLGSTAHDKSE